MEQNNYDQPFNDEEESGFDIMEWVSYFLHHWYLFVIGIILSLGLAYLSNRSWLPTFQTAGTVMIEDNRASQNGSQALMQGFTVQSGYKNVNNQVIMLGSYDLVCKVVDSLPYLKVDYISKGSFITRNLYKTSPIVIQPVYVSPEAYNMLFKIKLRTNGTYTITVADNKLFSNFHLDGTFGQPVQHNLFFITVNSVNKYMGNTEMYFQFRSRESLVSDFSSRLNFGYVVEGSSVLQISLTSETPDRDIDFINKLCETFLADNLDRKNDAANKTIKFIDNQLGVVSKSLSVSEGDMTNFRQTNKIVDVPTHTSDLLGKAAKFDTQKSELKLRETYLDYLTKYLKTNMADGAIIAPSSLGLNEPMLMTFVQQINELNAQRAETSELNPYHAKYTKEIELAKQTVMEVIRSMRASLDIEKNDFYKRLGVVNKEIDELPKKELEMIGIERKYKMDDNYYTFFLQKRAESEILKASNTPDNNILDKARILSITNSGKKSKTTLMFLLFGILIPTFIVVIIELLNNSIRSTKDVEKNSSFPLIGVIRHTKSSDPLLVIKNPRSSFTEMFRVIRTRIEFIVQRKTNIVIMNSSTESGDGKTYFSVNLASVYSMASKKTILVDMDIRKPSINQRFNIVQPNGVTNYLVGQCSLDEIILQLPKVDFDILPAGSIPPNPGELIRSDKLAVMFNELRKRYDYIIVDSSPIGMVTDAYSLAHLSDVNLFVIRNGKTNKTFFKKLCAQLKLDSLPNLYSILNDVEDDGSRYSKYKLYKYAYLFGYSYGYTSNNKKGEAEKYFHYYEDDTEI
ncbi:MAG: polysaccharide biosynthesis tyrosine autokinase [Bacteroidota bacterium]|nr:polysaccharide biosynthesis tyrosine autokinase [Bacteroidota bacterium]